MNVWMRLALAVLVTWRVTHLLANEDGPADVIVRFRARLGSGVAGTLLDCFNCLSLWVAAPAALFVSREFMPWLFTWLGLSGAACLLERTGHEPLFMQSVSPPTKGDAHDVLRTQTIGVAEHANSGHGAANDAASASWPS